MTKKLLLSTLLLVSVVSATETVEGNNTTESLSSASGWYAGVGIGIVNWGGSFETDISNSIISHNGDVTSSPLALKVGYLTDSENRIELYFKKDAVETTGGNVFINGEKFKTSTFGVNYQWGISSLSSDKILPFIRLGIGFGSSSSSLLAYDDGSVVELDLAVGAYYKVTDNIDLSAGIYRRAIVNAVENINNSGVDTTTAIATNGIEIGANYHF